MPHFTPIKSIKHASKSPQVVALIIFNHPEIVFNLTTDLRRLKKEIIMKNRFTLNKYSLYITNLKVYRAERHNFK